MPSPRPSQEWRLVLWSYPCPTCGAPAGQRCTTSGGKLIQEYTHADRGRAGNRCPVCRTLLPEDTEPGDLCPRCALVRALEVERATKHIRRDPDP